ncbi:MAG: uracil-DNA glycosylase [Psychrosphaera sp.]|nr:uracil-DNA glycosylase [Psychrosphaera sp.]
MPTWHDIIETEKQLPYLSDTIEYVEQRRAQGVTVFPQEADVFNAFKYTEFDDVKVVILGQDPYHGPDQAHGLCFSVLPGVKTPPSLKNMYKELAEDIADFVIPQQGFLESWAKQGVLMINSVLTVEQGNANSHKHLGWEQFTDTVIAKVNEHRSDVVFLLWGAPAQKKGRFIDTNRHHVLKAPHPSPLSAYRGFFGCRHFSMTNEILQGLGKTPINWQV